MRERSCRHVRQGSARAGLSGPRGAARSSGWQALTCPSPASRAAAAVDGIPAFVHTNHAEGSTGHLPGDLSDAGGGDASWHCHDYLASGPAVF